MPVVFLIRIIFCFYALCNFIHSHMNSPNPLCSSSSPIAPSSPRRSVFSVQHLCLFTALAASGRRRLFPVLIREGKHPSCSALPLLKVRTSLWIKVMTLASACSRRGALRESCESRFLPVAPRKVSSSNTNHPHKLTPSE